MTALPALAVAAALAATGAAAGGAPGGDEAGGAGSPASRLTLIAGGDLMPVGATAAVIAHEGADSLFVHVGPALRRADIAFANLEAPLTRRGTPTRGKPLEDLEAGRDYLFRGSPAVAAAMARAGVDVVSVANNHTMDYGPVGLRDTLTALGRVGVRPVGAGPSLAAARRPVVVERRGVRVAFLAYSDVLPLLSVAGRATPGIAPAKGVWTGRPAEHEIADDVRATRARADHVIVSMHWGTESHTMPDCRQLSLGRRILDAGATAVLGHHPHVLQPVEVRDGRLVAYSLGNLVASPRGRLARETALVTLALDRHRVVAWEAMPLLIERGRPGPAPEPVGRAVRARLEASTTSTAERCRRPR